MENRAANYWRKNSLAIRHKSGTVLQNLVCYLIFIAIAFMILFPLFEKLTVVFQSQEDLSNQFIPANFSMKVKNIVSPLLNESF